MNNHKSVNTLITLLIAGVLLLSAYVLVAGLLPYEPYDFIEYIPEQSEACPNQPIKVMVDRRIDESVSIDSIAISGSWMEAGGTNVGDVSANVGRYDDGGTDGPFPSSAFKFAPRPEGEWYPQALIEVRGSVLGWPRVQRVEASGSIPMTVLPADDELCKGG